MKRNFFCFLILIKITFLYMACATINYSSMNFNTNIKSQKLLNLRNCGIVTKSGAIGISEADKIVKNGFFSNSPDEYGFYHINIDYSNKITTGGAFLMFLNIYTLGIPTLIGLPASIDEYTVKVNFEIFNSRGILIKEYQEATKFKYYNGIYYGHSLNKKANEKYIQLLTVIMEQASRESEGINAALFEAGQIKQGTDALYRIYMYIAQKYSTVQFIFSPGRDLAGSLYMKSPIYMLAVGKLYQTLDIKNLCTPQKVI